MNPEKCGCSTRVIRLSAQLSEPGFTGFWDSDDFQSYKSRIREITVQTDNRKTLRVRLRGSQPWFSIASTVVRHKIPSSRQPLPATTPPPPRSVVLHQIPPFAKGGWEDFPRPIPLNFPPPSATILPPFRERGRSKRDADNKLAPAAVLQVPAQARPWSMISARRFGPIPFTRTRSSKDEKGRSSRICAARLAPMCLISTKDSTVAELTSICPSPHRASSRIWAVGVGAEVEVGTGVGVGRGVGVSVGVGAGRGVGISVGIGVAACAGTEVGANVGSGVGLGRGVAVAGGVSLGGMVGASGLGLGLTLTSAVRNAGPLEVCVLEVCVLVAVGTGGGVDIRVGSGANVGVGAGVDARNGPPPGDGGGAETLPGAGKTLLPTVPTTVGSEGGVPDPEDVEAAHDNAANTVNSCRTTRGNLPILTPDKYSIRTRPTPLGGHRDKYICRQIGPQRSPRFVRFRGRVTLFCNCSDLMCPSCSPPVIPGLTRNPRTCATSNGHYHWHFWIPACAGMTDCGGGT